MAKKNTPKSIKGIESPFMPKEGQGRSSLLKNLSELTSIIKERFPGAEALIKEVTPDGIRDISLEDFAKPDGKVIKTIPASKYKKEFDEIDELQRKVNNLTKLAKAKNTVVWAKIEEEHGDHEMRFNGKTNEIEILED